jgi:hypothetical protein
VTLGREPGRIEITPAAAPGAAYWRPCRFAHRSRGVASVEARRWRPTTTAKVMLWIGVAVVTVLRVLRWLRSVKGPRAGQAAPTENFRAGFADADADCSSGRATNISHLGTHMSQSSSVLFTLGGSYLFRVSALRHGVGMGDPFGSVHSLVGVDLTLEPRHAGDPFPYSVSKTHIRGPVSEFVKDALGRSIFGRIALPATHHAGETILDIYMHATADCFASLRPLLVPQQQGTLVLQLQTDVQVHRFNFDGRDDVKVIGWDLSHHTGPFGKQMGVTE